MSRPVLGTLLPSIHTSRPRSSPPPLPPSLFPNLSRIPTIIVCVPQKVRTSPGRDRNLVHVRPEVKAKEGGREGGREGERECETVKEGWEVEEHLPCIHEEGGSVVPLMA